MMRALGIILCLSLLPFICIAQDDIADKKSSLALGGNLFWNSKYGLKEDRGFKRVDISFNGNVGYFMSEYDFLLIRPRVTGEYKFYKSGTKKNEIEFGLEFGYRRFFGSSFFGGVFLGSAFEREYSSNYIPPKPQVDIELYAGLELGYIYFITPSIGTEAAFYYSARRKSMIGSENSKGNYYSRAGINVGLLYFLKLKNTRNDKKQTHK